MDDINILKDKTRQTIHDIRTPLVVIKTGINLTRDFLLNNCKSNQQREEMEKYCSLLANILIEANTITKSLNSLSEDLTK